MPGTWSQLASICASRRTVAYRRCDSWADEGYSGCDSWADEGSNHCSSWADHGSSQCSHWADEGSNHCCDWAPCSWFCKAFYWVAKTGSAKPGTGSLTGSARPGTGSRDWVCKAWYWIATGCASSGPGSSTSSARTATAARIPAHRRQRADERMLGGYGTHRWWKLMPDTTGSYVNGQLGTRRRQRQRTQVLRVSRPRRRQAPRLRRRVQRPERKQLAGRHRRERDLRPRRELVVAGRRSNRGHADRGRARNHARGRPLPARQLQRKRDLPSRSSHRELVERRRQRRQGRQRLRGNVGADGQWYRRCPAVQRRPERGEVRRQRRQVAGRRIARCEPRRGRVGRDRTWLPPHRRTRLLRRRDEQHGALSVRRDRHDRRNLERRPADPEPRPPAAGIEGRSRRAAPQRKRACSRSHRSTASRRTTTHRARSSSSMARRQPRERPAERELPHLRRADVDRRHRPGSVGSRG